MNINFDEVSQCIFHCFEIDGNFILKEFLGSFHFHRFVLYSIESKSYTIDSDENVQQELNDQRCVARHLSICAISLAKSNYNRTGMLIK